VLLTYFKNFVLHKSEWTVEITIWDIYKSKHYIEINIIVKILNITHQFVFYSKQRFILSTFSGVNPLSLTQSLELIYIFGPPKYGDGVQFPRFYV
jgi:hypothetical protein